MHCDAILRQLRTSKISLLQCEKKNFFVFYEQKSKLTWPIKYISLPQTSLKVWWLNVDFFMILSCNITQVTLFLSISDFYNNMSLYLFYPLLKWYCIDPFILCWTAATRNYCLDAIHHASEECWFYAWTNAIISIKRCTCTAKPQGLVQVSVQLRSVHFH